MFIQRVQTAKEPVSKPKLHWTSIWGQSIKHLKRTRPKPWNCLNVYAHVKWNETCRIHLLLYLHETHQRLMHALELERFLNSWIDWDAHMKTIHDRLPPTQKKKEYASKAPGTWNTEMHRKGRTYLDDLSYIETVVQSSANRNIRWFPLCECIFHMMQMLPSIAYSTFVYRETIQH